VKQQGVSQGPTQGTSTRPSATKQEVIAFPEISGLPEFSEAPIVAPPAAVAGVPNAQIAGVAPVNPFNPEAAVTETYRNVMGLVPQSVQKDPWFRKAFAKSWDKAHQSLMAQAIEHQYTAHTEAAIEQRSMEVGRAIESELGKASPDYAGLTSRFSGLHADGIQNPSGLVFEQVQAGYRKRIADGDPAGAQAYLDKAADITVGTAKISEGKYADNFQALRQHAYAANRAKQDDGGVHEIRDMKKALSAHPDYLAIATSKDPGAAAQLGQQLIGKIAAGQIPGVEPKHLEAAMSEISQATDIASRLSNNAQITIAAQHRYNVDHGKEAEAIIQEETLLTGAQKNEAIKYRETRAANVNKYRKSNVDRNVAEMERLRSHAYDTDTASQGYGQAMQDEIETLREALADGMAGPEPQKFMAEIAPGLTQAAKDKVEAWNQKIKDRSEAMQTRVDEILANNQDPEAFIRSIEGKDIGQKEADKMRNRGQELFAPIAQSRINAQNRLPNILQEVDKSMKDTTKYNKVGKILTGPGVTLGLINNDPSNLVAVPNPWGGTTLTIKETANYSRWKNDIGQQAIAAHQEWVNSDAGKKANDGSKTGFLIASDNAMNEIQQIVRDHVDGDSPLGKIDFSAVTGKGGGPDKPQKPVKPASETGAAPKEAAGASTEITPEETAKLPKVGERDTAYDQAQSSFMESDLIPAFQNKWNGGGWPPGNENDRLPDYDFASLNKLSQATKTLSANLLINPGLIPGNSANEKGYSALRKNLGYAGAKAEPLASSSLFRKDQLIDRYVLGGAEMAGRRGNSGGGAFHPTPMAAFVYRAKQANDPGARKYLELARKNNQYLLGTIIEKSGATPEEIQTAAINATFHLGISKADMLKGAYTTTKGDIPLDGTAIAFQVTPLFDSMREMVETMEGNNREAAIIFNFLGIPFDPSKPVQTHPNYAIFRAYQEQALERLP